MNLPWYRWWSSFSIDNSIGKIGFHPWRDFCTFVIALVDKTNKQNMNTYTCNFYKSKIWAFFKSLTSFRVLYKKERKNDHNSIIIGTKIKVKSNFIREKPMIFLFFNELSKYFFPITYQKVGFITTNIEQISNSICSKRFEFTVYTDICAVWKIKFFWLLRLSKSYGTFKKDPTFGFLTLKN